MFHLTRFGLFCLSSFFILLLTGLAEAGKPSKFQCPDTINVGWVEIPPYIYYDANKKITGLLVDMFEKGLNSRFDGCCAKNVSIVYSQPYRDYGELVEKSLNSTHDAVLPIISSLGKDKFLAFPFVLLIESPGAVLLNYRRQTTSTAIINTFVSSLPLVMLLLIYVCVFGVIFWIVDTIPKKNGEHRSVTEMAGEIGEGVWWAFVTLATVGYGDVIPTKMASRVICYIWMLISSVCIAFFTASVTSTLISQCFSMDLKIPGETIAAINGSREHQMILKKSGIPAVFRNYEEYLEKAILQEDIKGTVVELYAASFFTEKFKTFRIQEVFEDVTAYGVVLRTSLVKTQSCLKQFVFSSQKETYNKIRKELPPLTTNIRASAAEENSMGVLTPTMSTLRSTLLTISGIVVLLSVIGIVRERFFLKKTILRKNESAENFALLSNPNKLNVHNTISVTFQEMCEDINKMQNSINQILQRVNNRTLNADILYRENMKSN